MVDAATQMLNQSRRYMHEMGKLQSDLTMMQIPAIRGHVEALKGVSCGNPAVVRRLVEVTEELHMVLLEVLKESGTK
jgi:hypothetical protein